MSSKIGKKGLTSKQSFAQAAHGNSTGNSGPSKDHQPLAAPAPQPKGMGETSINRQAHYQRQSAMQKGMNPKNNSKNSELRGERAAKAFAMVASNNERLESQRSKGR